MSELWGERRRGQETLERRGKGHGLSGEDGDDEHRGSGDRIATKVSEKMTAPGDHRGGANIRGCV